MNREVHVRLREGLRGRFPRSTRLSRRDRFSNIVFIFRVSFAMNILEISHDFEVSKSLKSIAELNKIAQAVILY